MTTSNQGAPTAPPQASIPADPFELWLSQRPQWMQSAAGLVLQQGSNLSPQDIKNLADLCALEAAGKSTSPPQPLAMGSLSQLPTGQALRIEQLAKIQGVNALHPKAALDASKTSLLVVYGENGAGKSGFARLLKHACGDRSKTPLLPNVFQASPPAASAELTTSLNGATKTEPWTESAGALPSLRFTHVFDSHTAAIYLRDKSSATYQPRRMVLISGLISVCDQVSAELAARRKALPKHLPDLPTDLATSPAAAFIKSLKATTLAAEIDSACNLTEEMKAERLRLESLLANKDVKKRQEDIARALAALTRAEKEMTQVAQGLADTALKAVIDARSAARTARATATEGARVAFSSAPLTGVGSDTWMELWKQARAYSESTAYPGQPFPVVGSGKLCVLCQQQLDDTAGARLSGFEAFVRGGLEATALQKEQALSALLASVPPLPRREDWQLRAHSLGVDEQAADALLAQVESRRNFFLSGETLEGAPTLEWTPINTASAALRHQLEAEAQQVSDSQDPKLRAEMADRLLRLRGTEWLAGQNHSLNAEVLRLGKLSDLAKAESLARTNALTNKQNELAEQEIEAGYRQRFAAELGALGGPHLPVELKAFQEGKGRVSFQLGLMGAQSPTAPQSVLSEGEARIVALAAFLADITAPGGSAPFIFDDPVSSLDHAYEERVATRLLELAKTRQVIVFTHRLAFATVLLDTHERAKRAATAGGHAWPTTIQVTTLRRLGKHVGLPGGLSVRDNKPLSAMNKLKDQDLARLRNLEASGDVAGYEEAHSAYCANFRVILESAVEVHLLRGIVGRFRRDIQTKGKIHALAKISESDCALFDDLMTDYSTQEHSQPGDLPAAMKSAAILEVDAVRLITWLEANAKP